MSQDTLADFTNRRLAEPLAATTLPWPGIALVL